jgi:hypothetical protein
MKSIDIVIRCEPDAGRQAATSALESRKFRLDWKDEWSATAERGNKIANALAGALAQYFKVNLSLHSGSPGETIVRFEQASTGAMGGLIGVKRVRKNMTQLRDEVSTAFQEKGLLVAVNEHE